MTVPPPVSGVGVEVARLSVNRFSPPLDSPTSPKELDTTASAAKPPSTTSPAAMSAGRLLISRILHTRPRREPVVWRDSRNNKPILDGECDIRPSHTMG